ncbi:hypothetical protein [Prosthecobacter sp.]|uniref:hypothetical protein n=1 Tax=Prosthecobacter sp. TaxID=1965333 RepID=UPI0037830802
MKTISMTILAALLMSLTSSLAGDAPGKEESVIQEMRDFWVKSKAYLSDDWGTFKEGARLTLSDLSKQIDAVAAKTNATTPGYFQLRLQALKEQRAFLAAKLDALDSETIKTRMSGPRYVFDKCVSSLEAAVTQANDEADVLLRLSKEEKHDNS